MSTDALAALAGALRYAAAREFASLSVVKGLGGLALSAAAQASPAVAQVLRGQAGQLDAPELNTRRLAVTMCLRALESPAPTVPTARPSPKPPSAKPGANATAAQSAAPATATKKKRRAAEPSTEADERTTILSIAPASGPLATLLKQVGWRLSPRLVGLLNKKNITKVGDVLFLLPRTYEDRRELKRIAQLRTGERGTVIATVKSIDEGFGGPKGRRQFRAVLADASGSLSAVYFQSGPWLKAKFPIGRQLVVSGELRASLRGWEIPHPEVEPADDVDSSPIHFNRIVPVYPGFERHEQRALRELVFKVAERFADTIEEPLPDALRQKVGLWPLSQALKTLHFPAPAVPMASLEGRRSEAHQRLAFDELFFLQLGLALRRKGVKVQPGIRFDVLGDTQERAVRLLPFTLTGAQRRVVSEVMSDMGRAEPMNRLVQGDVGSGKTAVAIVAAAVAHLNGYQVAVMAPTEILAEQHHQNFSRILAPLGIDVALVTGSGGAAEKRRQREALKEGRAAVAVGTHALIEDSVEFHRLGFVVIDEQHRFGVMQRHRLMAKGVRPDVLVMTATPIPRTLAMTLYGDLDVSVIDELPPGRTPIETVVFNEKQRLRAYERVRTELAKGHQAYVVYPLVEESEKVDLADATQGAAALSAVFPDAKIGLLHGRMKPDEKDAVMRAFRQKAFDLLVSTTVIEVGVDVPNASVMVIEHAERFGLSQLHQLRGRVGRGAAQSHCLLMASYALSEEGRERLGVMEASTDGFVIAEKDLELRGPGEFLGTRQSGLPELAVADLARDQPLLAMAQAEARKIVDDDPTLEQGENPKLAKALEERWEGRLKLARVG
jgi:ATP-dependent DNA helicase RecG